MPDAPERSSAVDIQRGSNSSERPYPTLVFEREKPTFEEIKARIIAKERAFLAEELELTAQHHSALAKLPQEFDVMTGFEHAKAKIIARKNGGKVKFKALEIQSQK